MTSSVFSDNRNDHSVDQHRCLSQAYDGPVTAELLAAGITRGWQCLEVGAGNGTVAAWMATRVTPGGSVLATDLDPRHLVPGPGLAVLRHDLRHDPLPSAAFDLVHARQVLMLLPRREEVLDRMVGAVRPGGLLQLDDFAQGKDPAWPAVYHKFLAAGEAVLTKDGGDNHWTEHSAEALRAAGLVAVETVTRRMDWPSGSPGARLVVNHTRRLEAALLAEGMTAAELAEVRDLLESPGFQTFTVLHTVRGRRP